MTTRSGQAYRRSPSSDSSWWGFGALFTWLATSKDTDGQIALAEVHTRRGVEPPRHVHSHEDEAYFILDGAMTVTVGDRTIEAGPGSYVWLPREIEHGFKVETDVVRHLVLLTPAGLERSFLAFSEPAETLDLPPALPGPPDADEVQRQAEVFGSASVRFTPPSA